MKSSMLLALLVCLFATTATLGDEPKDTKEKPQEEENEFLTPIVCEVCQKVTLVVETVLRFNASHSAMFQNMGATLCKYLPPDDQQLCEMANRQLHKDVFECMIKSANLHTLCGDQAVELCQASARRPPLSSKIDCSDRHLLPDPHGCAACEFSIASMQQYVSEATSEIIHASIRDICDVHFPASQDTTSHKSCKTTLLAFGPMLIKLATARVDASQVCCGIGLCLKQ